MEDAVEAEEAVDTDAAAGAGDAPLSFYDAGLNVVDMQDGAFSSLFNSLVWDDILGCY